MWKKTGDGESVSIDGMEEEMCCIEPNNGARSDNGAYDDTRMSMASTSGFGQVKSEFVPRNNERNKNFRIFLLLVLVCGDVGSTSKLNCKGRQCDSH